MGGHLCLRETGSRKARLTSRVGLELPAAPVPRQRLRLLAAAPPTGQLPSKQGKADRGLEPP